MTSKKKKDKIIDKDYNDTYNNDVVFEETEQVEEKIKKLKEKLNKCLKENRENLSGWQRARADFVNAKKENDERVKKSFMFAREELMNELLPVMDSFDMAFSDKSAWEKVDKNWRIGVEYIYSQILSIFDKNDLKQVNPIGNKFDPKFHTSVEIIDTDKKKEDNIIVEVVQKGYEFNGKVMRAAKVKVAQYKK